MNLAVMTEYVFLMFPFYKSTCVSHDAVDKPDREARGLAASGAGTVDCARHNLKRPNGIGDLKKGERCGNETFIYRY